MEEKTFASKGMAGTALGLGIGALGLMALGGGNGNGFGLFNGGTNRAEVEQTAISTLEATIARLESEKYTDMVGLKLYEQIIGVSNAADAKLGASVSQLTNYIIGLERDVALNKQATVYENQLLNNKIDCCCDKMTLITNHNQELTSLADASIISYVNSNFYPAKMVIPASAICPPISTAK